MQDGMLEVASSFKKIFEQMRLISERLIQGDGDGKDIHILEKPHYVATFMSIDGSLRSTFVRRILREIRQP
ncbi:hypothetical protein L484_003100 [Morus notabilis]|uniref:Uncharacterized protein n=1 Tax=Morus notabilis TaxID=981085 RepID=W9QZL9_9ROSA|nr:hypothetical protein L484_003100 [Morus notabilis]